MTRADALKKKHGTYREFEDAAWRTLGECSVDEIMAACRKYARELADARLADLDDRLQSRCETEVARVQEWVSQSLGMWT